MSSRSPMNHDPYEHFATREALAEVATRLHATLPHLATKADVEKVSNRLLFWLTGTLVTCLLTFYGLHSNLMASQQEQIRELQASQQEQIRELQVEMRAIARSQQLSAEQLSRQQREFTDQISRQQRQLSEQISGLVSQRGASPSRRQP